MLSKLWAHLGTLLALVGATGTDAGAFHLPGALGLAVNAVAGVLVMCHLLSPTTVGGVAADVSRVLGGVRTVANDYRSAVDTARSTHTTPATAPATATATATAPPPA